MMVMFTCRRSPIMTPVIQVTRSLVRILDLLKLSGYA